LHLFVKSTTDTTLQVLFQNLSEEFSKHSDIDLTLYMRLYLFRRELYNLSKLCDTNMNLVQLFKEKPVLVGELGQLLDDISAASYAIANVSDCEVPHAIRQWASKYCSGIEVRGKSCILGKSLFPRQAAPVWDYYVLLPYKDFIKKASREEFRNFIQDVIAKHFDQEELLYEWCNDGNNIGFHIYDDLLWQYGCRLKRAAQYIYMRYQLKQDTEEIIDHVTLLIRFLMPLKDQIYSSCFGDELECVQDLINVLGQSILNLPDNRSTTMNDLIMSHLEDCRVEGDFPGYCFILELFKDYPIEMSPDYISPVEKWLIQGLQRITEKFITDYDSHILDALEDEDADPLDAEVNWGMVPFPNPARALLLLLAKLYNNNESLYNAFLEKCAAVIDPILSKSKVLNRREKATCRNWALHGVRNLSFSEPPITEPAIKQSNLLESDIRQIPDILSLCELVLTSDSPMNSINIWFERLVELSTNVDQILKEDKAENKHKAYSSFASRLDILLLVLGYNSPEKLLQYIDTLSKKYSDAKADGKNTPILSDLIEISHRVAMCLPNKELPSVLEKLENISLFEGSCSTNMPDTKDYYTYWFSLADEDIYNHLDNLENGLSEALKTNPEKAMDEIMKQDQELEFNIELKSLRERLTPNTN